MKKVAKKKVGCHVSRVTCHVSHVTCHMSRVTCHIDLHQAIDTDKLRYCFAEFLPMDGVVERVFAVEVIKAQVACKGVALGLATINQELGFVVESNATIDTHAIFMIFQIFFIRFASFQLTQKHKDETFVAIVIATGIAAVNTGVISSVLLLLLFIIVVGSIVKPQRSHHSGSRSHFFVRSSCLYAAKSGKSISILFAHFMIAFENGPYPQLT